MGDGVIGVVSSLSHLLYCPARRAVALSTGPQDLIWVALLPHLPRLSSWTKCTAFGELARWGDPRPEGVEYRSLSAYLCGFIGKVWIYPRFNYYSFSNLEDGKCGLSLSICLAS
jgi:hypothetical protein